MEKPTNPIKNSDLGGTDNNSTLSLDNEKVFPNRVVEEPVLSNKLDVELDSAVSKGVTTDVPNNQDTEIRKIFSGHQIDNTSQAVVDNNVENNFGADPTIEQFPPIENVDPLASDFNYREQNEVNNNAPAREAEESKISLDDTARLEPKAVEESASSPVANVSEEPRLGSLQLVVLDDIGQPIPNIGMKVLKNDSLLFIGRAAQNGEIFIDNLPIGELIELQVATDEGGYKQVAMATIGARENVASLRSPKTRIELTSMYHHGQPGAANDEKIKTAQKHNQNPAQQPQITGSEPKKPVAKTDRNAQGNPVAKISYGATDWFGLNRNDFLSWKKAVVDNLARNAEEKPSTSAGKHSDKGTSESQVNLLHLTRLVEFAERQAGWKYLAKDSSDTIVAKMRKRTLAPPESKLLSKSLGLCNKYVKVALAYAEYGKGLQLVGSGVSPAKDMGIELVKAGFVDVTQTFLKSQISGKSASPSQLDLVYVWPGDIVVYSKIDDPNADGHIDIRTYHGFISDFIWPGRNGFPDLKIYKILGVYRQYSDGKAMARVKAFLRILREHEAKGYKDPYRALRYDPSRKNDSHITFDDLSRHPSDASSNKPAGAYQIKFVTFADSANAMGWPKTFSEADQDRMAIYLLQGRREKGAVPTRTALGYIMEGKLEQAINNTKLWFEWSCLPSEGRESQMTMEVCKKKFSEYFEIYAK